LSSFVYYEGNSPTRRGDPINVNQFYNLMQGNWLDGTPISYGGNGDNGPTAPKYPFVFPSFPNEQAGTGAWSMCSENVTPGDYRFLLTSFLFVLLHGVTYELISGVV